MQHIHESLTSPFVVAGTELYVSASMGISLFPQDGDEPGGLLRNAEAAMYQSKKSGPAGYVVSARGSFDSSAKLQFVTKLRKAVEGRRWMLHYQPVIELSTGDDVGRRGVDPWPEPDGSMIPPGEFIPLAEELGLIETIGEWVVNEVVYQARAWRTWASTSRSASTCRPGSSGSRTWRARSSRRSGDGVGGSDAHRRRGDRVVRDDRPRPCPGDPVGAPPRRSPHRDRRLRHGVLVAVASPRRSDRPAEDRPFVRLGRRPGSAGGEHRDRVHRAGRRAWA